MERCYKCSAQVDTDLDDECYVRTGPEDREPACPACRAVIEAEREQEKADYYREWKRDQDAEQADRDLIDAGRGHLLHPDRRAELKE